MKLLKALGAKHVNELDLTNAAIDQETKLAIYQALLGVACREARQDFADRALFTHWGSEWEHRPSQILDSSDLSAFAFESRGTG